MNLTDRQMKLLYKGLRDFASSPIWTLTEKRDLAIFYLKLCHALRNEGYVVDKAIFAAKQCLESVRGDIAQKLSIQEEVD